MSDILKEAREAASWVLAKPVFSGERGFQPILLDAADEIERLRARVAELTGSLEHIARHFGSAEQCRALAKAALEVQDDE